MGSRFFSFVSHDGCSVRGAPFCLASVGRRLPVLGIWRDWVRSLSVAVLFEETI